MSQDQVARCLLWFSYKAGALQCVNNFFCAGSRQTREHIYTMTGVLTVMPSETDAVVSVSSGM